MGIFPYIYHKNQPKAGRYAIPMDGMGMCNYERWAHSEFNVQTLDLEGGLGFTSASITKRCWTLHYTATADIQTQQNHHKHMKRQKILG